MANEKNDIIDRIARNALRGGQNAEEAVEWARGGKDAAGKDFVKYDITAGWIKYECGCLCKRFPKLFGVKPSDPVVFKGTPQLAVYNSTCDFHVAGMNKFLGLGGYKDLSTWKIGRLKKITGEGRL